MLSKYLSFIYRRIDIAGVWLYMRVYKRPDLIRSFIRYLIPKRFKVRFICDKNYRQFGFREDPNIERLRLIHLVPPSVLRRKDKYLGSFKDISSKRDVFKKLYSNTYFEFVAPKGDTDLYFFLKFNHNNLKRLTQNIVIYIDIPGSFGKSVQLLRRLLPHAVIVFRAHNAEGRHSFEKFLVSFNPKWLIKSIIARYSDVSLLKNIDFLDSISRYDIDEYWVGVARNDNLRKIRHLPFFYSSSLLEQYFSTASHVVFEASEVLACFGSIGKANVLNNRGVRNLLEIYGRIASKKPSARFLVTGNYNGGLTNEIQENIEFVGVVDDPNLLLARSNYLIDISSIGYGFKTKFLDAALCGCRLVLDPGYVPRLPLEYYPFVSILQKDGSLFDYSQHSRDELRDCAVEINSRNYSHAVNALNFNDLENVRSVTCPH